MQPRSLLDMFAGQPQAPAQGVPGGLLDPALYGEPPAESAWQRAVRNFGAFTDNYGARPIADAAVSMLGLPGDAYLAASKLMGLPLGYKPEEMDLGYGRHVLPTSGDFQRLMAPLFRDTPEPFGPTGRVTQAALTGLASLPMGGEAPSLLTLLREGASGALPQAANEATNNASARLVAGLLPILIGSTKKPTAHLDEAAADLAAAKKADAAQESPNPVNAPKPARSLPGLGEIGPSLFTAIRIETTINPNSLVYRNPSFGQVRAMIDRDQWKTARYIQTLNGDVYVWPAGDANHDEMMLRLGEDKTKWRGTYFIDPTDGEPKISRD